MTKQLFLIRHAEAESSNFEIKDIERSLTSDGEIVASKVGKMLDQLISTPDAILSSSALRTRQTTSLLAEQIGFDMDKVNFKGELYEASTRILLREINELDEKFETVIIIAHNPAIPYLAEYITGEIIGGVSPCGIVQIKFDGSWAEISEKNTILVRYHRPPVA